MARFQFRRKAAAGAAFDPGDPDLALSGSAAVLAQRFGVRRGTAEHSALDDVPPAAPKGGRQSSLNPLKLLRRRKPAAPDGYLALEAPGRRKSRRLSAVSLAFGMVMLSGAGLLVWLALTAEETVSRLDPLPPVVAPILLPDGTPRFQEPVAATVAPPEVAPAEEVDPVDLPVELAPSRNEAMLERGPAGLLPVVAADGTAPWQHYARPFPQEDGRPRVAIVVADLGLSSKATDSAVARLPGAVTMAFVPGTADLQAQIDKARADGHEVLLSVPMEPVGFPANDPGPGTLLTNLGDERNISRLETAMTAATGYVGLTSTTGSYFLTRQENLRPILNQVQRRGLLYVDSRPVAESQATRIATEIKLPRAVADIQVDRMASPAGIDAQLAELERLAKANGAAVGFAQALPVTMERLVLWAEGLRERGVVLAPVSAVVNRQADR